jgi:replicative DNA helicase Mcm
LSYSDICFIISPIGESDSEIRIRSDQVFKYIISPVVKKFNYKPIRADHISEPGIITTQIIQHLVECPLVIADLTGKNPNVFYELAIRHVTGKPFIQMINEDEDIPFDVSMSRTIYLNINNLDKVENAKQMLEKYIKHFQEGNEVTDNPVTIAIDFKEMKKPGKQTDRVIHVEEIIKKREMLSISPEDEEEIKKLSQDPWIFMRFLNSISPRLYGYEVIKEAILYLLFGGVSKVRSDLRVRGEINILIISDPGTGIKQLLQFAVKASPIAIYTTGKGTSGAGLTASIIQRDDGNVELRHGALVIADSGLCVIDGIDKMRVEDRDALLPVMEQQVVTIARDGIFQSLDARTSILASANPTLGRYNPYQTPAQNINLPVTILSLFDLVFIIKDVPDAERDSMTAEKLLGLSSDTVMKIGPLIDLSLIRKYIAYAKKIEPKISEDVMKKLRDFYVKMRTVSVEGGGASAISITARQLESLVRLAEARARVYLREEITVEDAEASILLMQRSLEQVGIDITTGEIDIDILYTGKPRSLQMQLQKVLSVISEMEHISGVVRDDDLFDALMSDHGLNRAESIRLIGVLMKDGTIYSPRPGYYKKV